MLVQRYGTLVSLVHHGGQSRPVVHIAGQQWTMWLCTVKVVHHTRINGYYFTAEKQKSIHGNGEHWAAKEKRIRGAVEIEPDTPIKLIRKGIVRSEFTILPY